MRQSLCTISLDVQPSNLEALRRCIVDLDIRVKKPSTANGGGNGSFEQLSKEVPDLHFMSIMLFEDERYDPLVTIELNIDGDIATFLPQLEIPVLQPYLRALIRCCKRPSDTRQGAMYDAITAQGSKLPLTPFLEAFVSKPAAFHQGNRGLDRTRILANQALFKDVQSELKRPELCRAADARDIHKALRSALTPEHSWLNAAEVTRWTSLERAQDYARLAAFLIAALFLLSLPGMILALLMPALVVIALCCVAAFLLWRRIADALPKSLSSWLELVPAMPARVLAGIAGFLLIFAAVVAALFTALAATLGFGEFFELYGRFLRAAIVGVLTAPLPLIAVLTRLRWLEERDPAQDDPKLDPAKLRAIRALENEIEQNHMGSLVLLKTGTLRALLVRAGVWGLGYILRVVAIDGYLASMRTIHFAHWAIVSNGGRLVFFSNFDGSWESYLDDFIEKAHEGLTAAWTNGIGFPYTRFLIGEGASKGRLFKAWARHSMTEGLFWFRAYEGLSVNQIERQYRIASGLRKPVLSEEEAKAWAWDL